MVMRRSEEGVNSGIYVNWSQSRKRIVEYLFGSLAAIIGTSNIEQRFCRYQKARHKTELLLVLVAGAGFAVTAE
jgi:hypothetical protein